MRRPTRSSSVRSADKLVAPSGRRHQRGYHPEGGETLSTAKDQAAPADRKEYFHVGPVDVTADPYYTSALGRRHFHPNIWPAAPAGFEPAPPRTTGR